MKQCVRCWVHLKEDRKLWCKKCRERVDEEFRWEVSRPFEYYFRFNLKRMRHENNEMSAMLKRNNKNMRKEILH